MWCKAILIIFVAVIVVWIATILPVLKLGHVVWDHWPGACHLVPGVVEGSEDIQIFSDGTALITAGLLHTKIMLTNHAHRKGRVWLFNYAQPKQGVKAVTLQGDLDLDTFNPHGITAWEEKGLTRVWIVNHPRDVSYDRIEQFSWHRHNATLRHERSITDPAFHKTNDLAAVSSSSFYVTNFRYTHNDLEDLLMPAAPLGSVVFYDGESGTFVDQKGLNSPNGIALSPDMRHVYLMHIGGQEIIVYDRNLDNSLTRKEAIYLGTLGDNLVVEPTSGDIWIGAHPVGWRLALHGKDPDVPAPSLAVRVSGVGRPGAAPVVEAVFADSGRHLWGSSVAAYRQGGLLVGTVQHKLMYCVVKHLGVD